MKQSNRTPLKLFVLIALIAPVLLAHPQRAAAYGHMTYHGGMVEATSTTYAIFWLPSQAHFEPGGDDTRFQSLITRYFTDVGGTPYYKILTQYSRDGNRHPVKGGPIRNSSTFGGAYLDTTPYPHTGSAADPILGSDVRAAVVRSMQARHWTPNITHQFFVYLAMGTQVCDVPVPIHLPLLSRRPCTFASDTTQSVCVSRNHFMQNGKPVLYALVPNSTSTCVFDPNLGPNQDLQADTAVLLTNINQFDTVVDPLGNGWYHSNPIDGSIGLCDDLSNVALHGHFYLLAALWSNTQNTCVVQNPPAKQDDAARGYVTYHSGSIMPSTTTYAIYWLPSGIHLESNGLDSRYQNVISQFFRDIGGTDYYNIVTQYSMDRHGHPVKNGPIQNSSTFGGSTVDTRPYPHAGTTDDPLNAGDMETEIGQVMQANHWKPGLDRIYFLFLGSGINICQGITTLDSCTYPSVNHFCAYHSYFWQNQSPVIFSVNPDMHSLPMCRGFHFADPAPNGDAAADTELSLVAHELFEAITDPLGFGWTGSPDHWEIGDNCQSYFGVPDPKDGANVTLHGDRYLLQAMWSNASRSCALGYTSTGFRR